MLASLLANLPHLDECEEGLSLPEGGYLLLEDGSLLLVNDPVCGAGDVVGGVGGGQKDKERRLADTLREEYLERQREIDAKREMKRVAQAAGGEVVSEEVFNLPKLVPSITAVEGVAEDKELALILILAEI